MTLSRSFLIALIAFCVQSAVATQPIRTILVRQADGTVVALPYHKPNSEKGHAGCCSHMNAHRTRALAPSTADGLGKFGQRSEGLLNSIGEHNIPVIMVEFQDVEFKEEHTEAKIDSLFNYPGFKPHRSSRGCVRDYFVQQSYGNFTPNFTVVGKFKAKNNRAYYGANSGTSKGVRAIELYREMVTTAIENGVDFTPFLENNRIPLVILQYAGPGEHNSFETGSENYLWAHFREHSIEVKGIRLGGYFIGNEVANIYKKNNNGWETDEHGNPIVESTRLDGIGVLCHELGHALGLPDAYNTESQKLKTPDFHDIMDYGQYCSQGYRPVGYSAYQRSMLGWLDIKELTTEPGYKVLGVLHEMNESSHPKAYAIRNPEKDSEYFILENRQEGDWFNTNYGKGMLIYHVDYDRNSWLSNTSNNDSLHLRYVVVPADGSWQNHKTATGFDMYKGDFFPGLSQKTDFTTTTVPAMTWYKGSVERPLFGIKEHPDGLISFAYIDPQYTHIAEVPHNDGQSEQKIYTLDGRVVTQQPLSPGVYIKNRRKLIVQ